MNNDYEKILARLENSGYPSYLVGGFVRDKLLKRESFDIDIATLARPNEIKEVFSDYCLVDIGKKFGTIKVIDGKKSYEITTFRSDSQYIDNRHPQQICFSQSIYEDLARRDFTINAISLRKCEFIDPFDGRSDLDKKIIRAVGNPFDRISEDYLRALRAVRFASVLAFTIEDKLKEAIRFYKKNISYISSERIRDEFIKLILAPKPSRGIRLMEELGLLEEIFPQLQRLVGFDQHSIHHYLDVYDHSLEVLDHTPANLVIRLAALFHDAGKPETFFLDDRGQGRFFGHQNLSKEIADEKLKELKFSKKTIDEVGVLIKRHMDAANTYTLKSVGRLYRKLGEENLLRLFDLQEADKLATTNKDISNIKTARSLLKEFKNKNLPKSRKDLAIDGRDLIKIGFKEGKKIGEILKIIEEKVFCEALTNEKSEILEFVRSNWQNLDR